MKTYSNFTVAYVKLIEDVYRNPDYEVSPRGMKIREKLGYSFRIADARDRLPYVPHREFSISYCIAELLWYLSGNNSTEWIGTYAPFWKNISDDGQTANSAYGSRIFKSHPRIAETVDHEWTQWKYVTEELKRDPDSRRAVVHIRSPHDSILAQKDIPCTIALQFFIREGFLHQVAMMRSSDLILGIAYDVPAFTMFQELLANQLGVGVGSYTHISNSLHLYERDFAKVENILDDPWVKKFSHRAKPMDPLPNEVPLEMLMSVEAGFRASNDESSLRTALSSSTVDLDPYWQDWLTILARYRANRLKLTGLSNELTNALKFPGYSLFSR